MPPHYLGIFLALVFCACSNEDLETSTTPSVVSQLKNDLNLDQFANKSFETNIIVNWDAFSRIEKEGLTIYEIPITEINQTTITSVLFQEQLKYGLIAIKKGGEMHSYLIEAYSSVNHSVYANTIENLAQFTGTLNVYELNGDLINQLVVFNGKSTNPSNNSNLDPLHEAINLFYKFKNTTSRVPSCNITQFVPIVYQHEVRHYVPTVIVGTYTNLGYSYSTFTLTTTGTYMSVPYPCDADADYHHVPYMITTHEDVFEEIIIDSTFLDNTCLKSVYDKLGQAPHFQSSLLEFDNDFSIVNLKLSVGIDPKYPNATAATYEPVHSLIEIKYNPNKLDTPQLDIARTFMHEMIHAEMYRKLLALSGKNEIPWSAEFIESIRNNGKEIAEYYTRYRYNIPAG